MSALGPPLEALALNYFSYGLLTAVNNIWTWVAVVTAAVSFWAIKASSLLPSSTVPAITSEHPSGKIPDGSCHAKLVSSPVERVFVESAELTESASTCYGTPPTEALEREGSTKGRKFTVYYDNEDGESKGHDNCNGGGIGEGKGDGGVVVNRWWERWDGVMKIKMGDEEWYSYQDLTVINGSVVRLWDDCRRRNATAFELVCGASR